MDLFARLAQSSPLRAAVATRRLVRGPKRPSWSLELEIVAEFMRLYGPISMRLTAEQQRRGAEKLIQPNAVALRARRESAVGHGVPGEWFTPPTLSHDAVLYYLHGGGYVIGSANTHQNLIAQLCEDSGCRAFAINYRLAPEHPFPAAIEDAVAGYRYLLERGTDPARIVVAGDSAGGGLMFGLLQQIRDLRLPRPAAGVGLSPWCDVNAEGATIALHAPFDYIIEPHLALSRRWLMAGQDARHPLVSAVHADLTGLPPLLIQAGGAEALLDDAVRVTARAREAGVSVQLDVHSDMPHVFQLFTSVTPIARRALADAAAFLRTHTGGHHTKA
jgi:acetyl esterase/lipase